MTSFSAGLDYAWSYFTYAESYFTAGAEALVAGDYGNTVYYDAVAAVFSPDEVAALVSLIVTINAWNAISVATRAWEPGSYQP